MRVLRAVTVHDWRRDQLCCECGSSLEIASEDVIAVNFCPDPESAPDWRFGFVCVVCGATCVIVDRPLPSYVREAALARAREEKG